MEIFENTMIEVFHCVDKVVLNSLVVREPFFYESMLSKILSTSCRLRGLIGSRSRARKSNQLIIPSLLKALANSWKSYFLRKIPLALRA